MLISPFLKLNDRIKELLEDKNRLKIDVRIVYSKSELQPQEIEWLKAQSYIRTSFCKNLHAKCYLNEENAIVTSLNLYKFSQINNNEMGILIRRDDDAELYKDTYEEAQRIIRINMERFSAVCYRKRNCGRMRHRSSKQQRLKLATSEFSMRNHSSWKTINNK